MLKEAKNNVQGNEEFEGYAVDELFTIVLSVTVGTSRHVTDGTSYP